MSLRTSDYDYPLPEELIARYPLAERTASRMMVVDRKAGTISHHSFRDLPRFLSADDLLVLNNTRVIPARLYSDDGRTELLLLEPLDDRTWRCMVRPGRRMKVGREVVVGGVTGRVLQVEESGERHVAFDQPLDLDRVGRLPLPPYFERENEPEDTERYQTVFASQPGAVAAPTAGLHFTPEVLERLRHAFVTLHVGAGTFRPVQTEVITEHPMHEERYTLPTETVEAIAAARRVVAIGTTTLRVLEGRVAAEGALTPGDGRTRIFIYPGYQFQVVGALLTNFHLPKSTLLMLVSAFAGMELTREAYEEAIREAYRFYSYGDCMLIL